LAYIVFNGKGKAQADTKEERSMKYNVYANAIEFGIIEAGSEQEARDKAAQMAGYESEADLEERLDQSSEIVAEEVE
jgi:hypothetical protein